MDYKRIYRKGNIIRLNNSSELTIYMVEGAVSAGDYMLLNLANKEKHFLNCEYIDQNSLLLSLEPSIQAKKKVAELLNKK